VKIGTLFTNSKVFYIVASYPHVFPRLKKHGQGVNLFTAIYIYIAKTETKVEKIGFQTYCIHKHIITHVHIVTSESQNAHAYCF
jgi:DNA-directed RNA polymerase subunit N (RpoN/RPB10)